MQRPLALHSKLFGLLVMSHYSKVNCFSLKARLTALLGVFLIHREKETEFTPLLPYNAQGGVSVEIKATLQQWFYTKDVPEGSPSALSGSSCARNKEPELIRCCWVGRSRHIQPRALVPGEEPFPHPLL